MDVTDTKRELASSLRPMARREYDDLVARGFFDDERVELLHGMVVQMSPTDPGHDQSVAVLTRALVVALATRASVRVQSSFAASDDSEPEPDVLVAPPGEYWHAHPDRALLLVEVARTSLRRDRRIKGPLYGGCAVDEYWIVNMTDRRLEIYRRAGDGAWAEPLVLPADATVAPLAFPDVLIRVADLLPPP